MFIKFMCYSIIYAALSQYFFRLYTLHIKKDFCTIPIMKFEVKFTIYRNIAYHFYTIYDIL